ncbi:MAG TPA: gas vesicle protein GvpG [Thermoanaerobaculia bacterium]|jgi:hypothetical protein|nr:gas vesicle protein GvpG [Thermoanaerobaculia bacterium]
MAVILDSLLFGGIRFVLDQLATVVDGEMNDEGSLREELLATQMRFELGEIEEDELAGIETEIMARLREIRANREGDGVPAGARVIGVDVAFNAPEDSDER